MSALLLILYCAVPLQVGLASQKEVNGKVHEGFYAALFHRSKGPGGIDSSVALFQRICEKLAQAVGEDKSLFVTGHSLGNTQGSLDTTASVAFPQELYLQGRFNRICVIVAVISCSC